jgi:hypothetical protein
MISLRSSSSSGADHEATLNRGWGDGRGINESRCFLNGRYSALAETLSWMPGKPRRDRGYVESMMGTWSWELNKITERSAALCIAVLNHFSGLSSVYQNSGTP